MQNQGIGGIAGAHFRASVNPHYSQSQTDDLFKFNVIVHRGDPEHQTQTEEAQNYDFVKTLR